MSQQRDPYANVRRPTNRFNQIDTHEILKNEIYKQGSENDTNFKFGFNGPNILGGPAGGPVVPMSPSGPSGPSSILVGFEDTELYLDSVYRDSSSDYTNGEIKWSLSSLNNTQDVKGVIQMHIPPFYFPKIYSTYDGTSKPEYFYYRRVMMELQTAPTSQAIFGPNNNKYHFEFEVDGLSGQAVKLIPTKDAFFFQRPITSLSDFNIRFMVPQFTSSANAWKKIPLPADTVTIRSVAGSNPIRFDIVGTNTEILAPIGSAGSPGVAVVIRGLATNDNTVNDDCNDTNGNYVTTIVSSSRFEIAAINGATVDAGTYTATMYVPKNRIAFPVRFTSVRDQLTNYISVGHD